MKLIDPVNHRKWFDDLTVLRFDAGHLEIACPDEATTQYMQDKCVDNFTRAAQNITDHLVSVSFTAVSAPSSRQTAPNRKDTALRLHPDYTFDNFVVGPCNRLAHASCVAVSNAPGQAYNPLFLYGSVGLGKTHLLHAVTHEAKKTSPRYHVQFLSCEEFVNRFISAIEHGRLADFQSQFRSVDILIIDDIQFLRDREQSQEEFFHTFNALYNNHRQIVLTADCAPADLPSLEERLISRFKWGLVAHINPPCYETRIAIVQKKAHLRGLPISEEVAGFIAQKVTANIRELEGALTIIYAVAQTGREPITLALAHRALGSQEFTDKKNITITEIIDAVTRYFGLRIADLQSKKRSRSITTPRQMCMYLARDLTKHSLEEIGGHLGGRDHTTVLHACTKIKELAQTDPQTRVQIEELTAAITKK